MVVGVGKIMSSATSVLIFLSLIGTRQIGEADNKRNLGPNKTNTITGN